MENVNQNGEVPDYQLHTACKKGQKNKVLQLIKEGQDVNSKDSEDLTPLDVAIKSGRNCGNSKWNAYLEIVKILLKHGANLKDKHKSFKPSRLYIFHDKFAEFLIEEGITTQLHMACRKGQKSKVLQLIKDGHEVNSAPAGEFILKFIFLMNLKSHFPSKKYTPNYLKMAQF